MIITYWDTLYKQIACMRCFSQITFTEDGIKFTSGGHRYCIYLDNVIKIELISNN